jgi:hypothetical protein
MQHADGADVVGGSVITRFLYFAAGREVRGLRPLMLDEVLAGAMRYLTGDATLLCGTDWNTEQFAFYLAFMTTLAARPQQGGGYRAGSSPQRRSDAPWRPRTAERLWRSGSHRNNSTCIHQSTGFGRRFKRATLV